MATYSELYDLSNDAPLLQKVTVGVMIAAITVQEEDPGTTNHANRLLWANKVIASPQDLKLAGKRMLIALLAANNSSTVSQIQSVTDATIQTNVNNKIDDFAGTA